jgi:hypothetical protein
MWNADFLYSMTSANLFSGITKETVTKDNVLEILTGKTVDQLQANHEKLIGNVLELLKRSQGLLNYGTKIKKEQMKGFLEIFKDFQFKNDPEIIGTIDPGSPKKESRDPEDNKGSLKDIKLKFSEWINFLNQYATTSKTEGDYFTSNPAAVYNEWQDGLKREEKEKKIDDFTKQIKSAEEKWEQIFGNKKYDLFFDFIRDDLRKLNDFRANIEDTEVLKKLFLLYAKIEQAWSGEISDKLKLSEEKSEPKVEEGSTAELISGFISSLENKITSGEADKIRDDLKKKAEEERKKKDDDEQQKKDAEDKEAERKAKEEADEAKKKDAEERIKKEQYEAAATKIQKLYRDHAARKKLAEAKAEAKKKALEQQKKDDEAKEEARIKEEERKAKEDAEVLKQQREKEALEKEEAKIKEEAEAKKKADEAKEEEKKSPTLEHKTKQRAHQKKRKPTQSGKIYQQQKQALEEKQLEHQKKVETLSDLINLAEAKISTSEGEIPTFQAIKDDKLTQEQLDTLKKELESKINESNQYTDLGNLIEDLYKTDKTLESKIGILTEILNKLFPNLENIKQFISKILKSLKLESQECIDRICSLVESAKVGQGIFNVKLYDKKIPKATQESIPEFKTKIISLSNRLIEPVDATTIQTAIDKVENQKFKHIEQAFLNLNYTPAERQTNPKLDIIIKAKETRTQKTKFEQDKKAQDAAEAAAAEAKAAQEKKLSAAAEKKQGEEAAKAKIKQDWDSEIAKIQKISPETIQIADLDFIKEDKYKGLNFDTNSSSLILKFIQSFCKQLDQKNDEYLEKLSDLLIKIKNKKCFDKDSQQQKDFNLCNQYVNTWNIFNKIFQKRNISVENVRLSGTQLTKAQAYTLKQSVDTNISEIKGYADELKDPKKYPILGDLFLGDLLKKMIEENIVASANLQIIYTILFNVLDNNYKKFIATIKSVLETAKQKTPQKTGTGTQPKPHESPAPTALKQKFGLLKQNLEKLKTKLSQLSQKLGQLKTNLPRK